MFPSEDYDVNVAYSRSADVLRSLQSAESFLRDFFPELMSLYPAIHTVPEKDDYLLYTNYAPQFQFYWCLDVAGVRAVCNPVVDRSFPDFNALTAIAREVHSEEYCGNFERGTDCAFALFDIAAAKESIGELESYPMLGASLDGLSQVTREHFARQYLYNRSDTRCFQQGSSGQPILQEFLKNIDAVILGSSSYKLYHYSAHDTMLSRIVCSLQDTTDDGLLPPFAQTRSGTDAEPVRLVSPCARAARAPRAESCIWLRVCMGVGLAAVVHVPARTVLRRAWEQLCRG
ncbi:hypothetical protein LSCM4_04766 [Leishmania orientalis]|uniref:Histidine acid phosphatase n=1 Tax=Leishmania orientalis TaxID=2249476 RepID=A0A836HBQ0_9TRYP|nr:hypothetical protein LSCM4_04766 [Leishmania orientalis]